MQAGNTGNIKETLGELEKTLKTIEKVNSLLSEQGCVDGDIIGNGRSDYTRNATVYDLRIKGKKFALIDIPGIEGDESAFESTIREALESAHVIYYINGSGKKIEKESLEKIKKYMHDGTSVYAIFNVHCKAKKERVLGVDKEYSEELESAYNKQEAIVKQTKDELVSFLGKNYKGSISLNGLLGFCAIACENGRSTIKEDKEKNLKSDQNKYLKEYQGDTKRMMDDSHMYELLECIEKKIGNYETDIVDENLKKLKNRMNEMHSRISILKRREVEKIDGFIRTYDEFEKNCYNAKEDYIRTMKHIASDVVQDAFYDLMNEMFDKIEKDAGKTKTKDVMNIYTDRKDEVVSKIQHEVNDRIAKAQLAFEDEIRDAQERMKKDFEREQIQFEISLTTDSLVMNSSFATVLKFDLNNIWKDLPRTLSLAIAGAGVGMIIPGLGNVVGALIGGGVGIALGILNGVWNYFISEKRRINIAKSKIQKSIDEQIHSISKQINIELLKTSYERKINEIYKSLCKSSEIQKKNLIGIKKLIIRVENEMSNTYKSIA